MLYLNIEIIALYLNLLEKNISNYILNFFTILAVIFILFYLKRYDYLFQNNSIFIILQIIILQIILFIYTLVQGILKYLLQFFFIG